jgi:hypothetical protein
MTFQANIFDDLLHFQTEYFRWNTRLFKSFIFGGAESFPFYFICPNNQILK